MRLRKKTGSRQISVGALHAAVCNPHAVKRHLLKRTGNIHHRLQKKNVIRTECVIPDQFFLPRDLLRFRFRIADRQTCFLLERSDLPAGLHPFFKQKRHLPVNFTDLFSQFIQFIHPFSLPLKKRHPRREAAIDLLYYSYTEASESRSRGKVCSFLHTKTSAGKSHRLRKAKEKLFRETLHIRHSLYRPDTSAV